MMVKRCVAILLGAILLLSLTGCGAKKKVEEKLTEKIAEGIIDKIAGEDVDIDLDGDKISVKDDEGNEWSVGGGKWPEGRAGQLIPEFKGGTIESVIETNEGFMVYILDVDQEDYEQYVEQLKDAGYTEDTITSSSSETIMYSGRCEGKAGVAVMYSSEGNITITCELQE